MKETRTCTKCHRELPATREYFAPSKLGSQGLRADCRECRVATPGSTVSRSQRKRKPIEITLSDEARERLEALALEWETTRSGVVERLLKAKKKTQ